MTKVKALLLLVAGGLIHAALSRRHAPSGGAADAPRASPHSRPACAVCSSADCQYPDCRQSPPARRVGCFYLLDLDTRLAFAGRTSERPSPVERRLGPVTRRDPDRSLYPWRPIQWSKPELGRGRRAGDSPRTCGSGDIVPQNPFISPGDPGYDPRRRILQSRRSADDPSHQEPNQPGGESGPKGTNR